MELRNIHSRKDYKKVYEVIGGTSGGVGASDGFANNASLKDTYLGKLVNGIFKGIGWLWRKSKENFVINRLIAQLVNELMRGVILFCFENNINLEDGKKSIAGEEIKGFSGESEDGILDDGITSNTGDTANTGVTTNTGATMSEADLVKEIGEFKQVIEDNKKEIKSLEGQIKQYENNIAAGNYVGQDKKNKQAFLDKLKQDLEKLKQEILNDENKLAELEKQLATLKGNVNRIISFDVLEKACKDKYDFNATGEYVVKQLENDVISYPDFQSRFKKKYQIDKIKIGDKFTIMKNGVFHNIEVYDVDTVKSVVSFYENNKLEMISNVKLLTHGFPSFKNESVQAEAFIKNHINEYNNMNDKQKLKIELIYMHYAMIKEMREIQRSAISESIQFLNEENLVKTIGSKLGSAGTAKVKPDEPMAGKVSLGKSIGMKAAGVSAKVGDILTIRDKKKFKEKEDEFGLDVHSINLAEIEKTIQELDQKNEIDVKAKVSSYVNPYNLKTIEISAEQLLAPDKPTEGGYKKWYSGDNEALRLRWNKEVSKTYAAFTNLMDIQKLHTITKDGGITNSEKVTKKVESTVRGVNSSQQIGEISDKLVNILEPGFANYKSMSKGDFCFYSFLDNKNLCNTSIAPVLDAFNKDFGLINITSFFNSVDNLSIDEDLDSTKKFTVFANDKNKSIPSKKNIYFLIRNGQAFPASNTTVSTKVFVLNEFVYSDGTSDLFIKKNSSNPSVSVDKNLLNNFNKSDYLFNVGSVYCKKFKRGDDFNKWKPAFKYISSPQTNVNFNDFQVGKPFFVRNTPDTLTYLKQLADMLNT